MNPGREHPPAPGSDDALIETLDRAATLERRLVAESRQAAPTAEELRAVEAALERASGARPRGLPVRAVLAAAAVIVASFLVWRFVLQGPRELPSVPLGNNVEILEPTGAVDAFTRLRWRTTSQGSPRFAVRVVDAATHTILLEVRDLQALELPLDNHDTSTWQRIRVEVDELGSSPDPVKAGSAEAWRRSP